MEPEVRKALQLKSIILILFFIFIYMFTQMFSFFFQVEDVKVEVDTTAQVVDAVLLLSDALPTILGNVKIVLD